MLKNLKPNPGEWFEDDWLLYLRIEMKAMDLALSIHPALPKFI